MDRYPFSQPPQPEPSKNELSSAVKQVAIIIAAWHGAKYALNRYVDREVRRRNKTTNDPKK